MLKILRMLQKERPDTFVLFKLNLLSASSTRGTTALCDGTRNFERNRDQKYDRTGTGTKAGTRNMMGPGTGQGLVQDRDWDQDRDRIWDRDHDKEWDL